MAKRVCKFSGTWYLFLNSNVQFSTLFHGYMSKQIFKLLLESVLANCIFLEILIFCFMKLFVKYNIVLIFYFSCNSIMYPFPFIIVYFCLLPTFLCVSVFVCLNPPIRFWFLLFAYSIFIYIYPHVYCLFSLLVFL